ncbi:YjgB family protein [Bacillus thermocopriae]|uniref:YjgB family protein n=1 Tax=Neobacillus thermocopriae TaxID=1215031 RepID=A0A6B3TNH0_9BACI|nr:YjgB family protein [Neobacillus thermocopriae]MED3625349.1 YjgB family protein [Neobacillus thermocopriae]MED3714095.1 YjgB family protein [Neobacillus thermocopriae]NEX77896.1 YjgB family protein [Neobacillus thermocopriae]
MKRIAKIYFIPCLLALLVGCSNDQETEAPNTSPKQPPTINEPTNPTNPSNPPSNSQPNNNNPKHTTLIQEIVSLAKVGTVKNCSFPASTTVIDEVKLYWGEPDQEDFVAGNRYFTFSSHGIVFGVNKGEQIFDVRSYSKEIQQITFDEVEKVLGKPNNVRSNSGDKIWVYNVNEKFQLKFVGSKSTIDHISVFYPAGAKNQMAG